MGDLEHGVCSVCGKQPVETFCSNKCRKRFNKAKKKHGCWIYRLLDIFYKPNQVRYCCVGCKRTRKNCIKPR